MKAKKKEPIIEQQFEQEQENIPQAIDKEATIETLTRENIILKNTSGVVALWEIREALNSLTKAVKDLGRLYAVSQDIEIEEDEKG